VLVVLVAAGVVLHQDFMCLDRGIPAAQAAQYGDLAQFPIAGQALVLAYNISTLSSTDPLLVRAPPLRRPPSLRALNLERSQGLSFSLF